MLRWMIGSSLKLRFLVVVVAFAMMAAGVARLRDMPVDVLPEFAPPYIEVQTEAPGLSTAEVETLISLNLEELLNGTPWLKTIRSRSVPGLSSLILVFEPETDVMRARQLVQERLLMAHMLPNVSKPPVILQPMSATSRVMMIGLTSKEVSPIEMSVLARWKIRPALMGVTGVANVAVWGHRERQLQVQVDPERLRAQGVTLNQIVETAGDSMWVSPLSFLSASTPGTGGWIDTPQQRLEVRHVLPISSPDDLARVTVAGTEGLRLGDVAQVVENHPLLIGDAVLGDDPGLLFIVEKLPGANTLEVTQGVEARLDELRPGLAGIEIDTGVFRPATFLELAIGNLGRALLLGAALVIAVLFAFLRSWRVAVIAIVTIPASLVAAMLVLYQRGETLNAMVLVGLVVALGVVVDDAVVGVESVARRLRQPSVQGADKSTATIVLEASLETRHAMLFAALILVLAVLPVLSMGGVSGSFFGPLAVSYALAVLASTVVALALTPALSLILMPRAAIDGNQTESAQPDPRVWPRREYDRALAWILPRPRLAHVAVGVALLIGLGALSLLSQRSLLPSFREPDLMIQWDGAPGTSLPAMTRLTTQASRELRSIPGVRNVAAHVGRAVMGDQVVGAESARIWVSVDPAADYEATVAAIQETVDGYPGTVHDVRTYVQQTLRQVLTGSNDAIVVRIFGPEFDVLNEKAEEVRQALSTIEGVVDLRTELQVEEPYVEIEVDLAEAERYGIKPGDVRRAAATLINGIEAGSLFEQQKVFEVVVWSTSETRRSLTDVRDLLIDTPGGGHVRLGDLAEVRVASTLSVVNREAVSRHIDVGLNVAGRDHGLVARDVDSALQQVEFPLEYHAEVLGEYAERQATLERFLVASAIAAVGIFLLLQAAFQSWRLATVAFVALPAALVGALLAALVADGGVISLGSLAGFLAVLGIATRNGIMQIGNYQHLEEHGGETFGKALVLRGARERAAPTLATALATGLALAPFALFGIVPGLEIARSLAIVVLGGLVTSTLLNLFVVPTLYLRHARQPAGATRRRALTVVRRPYWHTSGPANTQAEVLVAHDIRKSYGPRLALRGLSFSLRAGRVLGFLGANGAGKTTAIRILTTIMEPSSGYFAVDGVGSDHPEVIRRKIGVLPENLGFPKQITGIEYLTFFGQLYGRTSTDAREYGLALLEEVGLLSRAESLVGTYSRGMRQRLGIARALVNDPVVLFLDEPTLGLDPRGQQDLLSLIQRIARQRAVGVVLCSHALSEIENVCDDVVILSSGRIVAQGTVAEVIGGAQRNVVRIQVPAASVAGAQQLLGAMPYVKRATHMDGTTDWLHVELIQWAGDPSLGKTPAEASSGDGSSDRDRSDGDHAKNAVLAALVQAGIPIQSYAADGGRLRDVFFQLTEEVAA